jgi:hypothetical protein
MARILFATRLAVSVLLITATSAQYCEEYDRFLQEARCTGKFTTAEDCSKECQKGRQTLLNDTSLLRCLSLTANVSVDGGDDGGGGDGDSGGDGEIVVGDEDDVGRSVAKAKQECDLARLCDEADPNGLFRDGGRCYSFVTPDSPLHAPTDCSVECQQDRETLLNDPTLRECVLSESTYYTYNRETFVAQLAEAKATCERGLCDAFDPSHWWGGETRCDGPTDCSDECQETVKTMLNNESLLACFDYYDNIDRDAFIQTLEDLLAECGVSACDVADPHHLFRTGGQCSWDVTTPTDCSVECQQDRETLLNDPTLRECVLSESTYYTYNRETFVAQLAEAKATCERGLCDAFDPSHWWGGETRCDGPTDCSDECQETVKTMLNNESLLACFDYYDNIDRDAFIQTLEDLLAECGVSACDVADPHHLFRTGGQCSWDVTTPTDCSVECQQDRETLLNDQTLRECVVNGSTYYTYNRETFVAQLAEAKATCERGLCDAFDPSQWWGGETRCDGPTDCSDECQETVKTMLNNESLLACFDYYDNIDRDTFIQTLEDLLAECGFRTTTVPTVATPPIAAAQICDEGDRYVSFLHTMDNQCGSEGAERWKNCAEACKGFRGTLLKNQSQIDCFVRYTRQIVVREAGAHETAVRQVEAAQEECKPALPTWAVASIGVGGGLVVVGGGGFCLWRCGIRRFCCRKRRQPKPSNEPLAPSTTTSAEPDLRTSDDRPAESDSAPVPSDGDTKSDVGDHDPALAFDHNSRYLEHASHG